jgi:hypothetical protein
MRKLSLLKILEGFYSPETPGPRNAHMFNTNRTLGDPLDSDHADMMSDEEIADELKLEFKLGLTMRDPTNLSNHNVHNGSFSLGKGSKSFGNYQTKSNQGFNDSQEDVMVNTYSANNPDNLSLLSDPQIAAELGLTKKERPKGYADRVKEAKIRGPEGHWKDARSIPRPIIKPLEEEIGAREKGLAYGAAITTKQPFASGMPSITDSEFYSDEEIAKELGLTEWISSTPVFNKKFRGPKAELDFFEAGRPVFVMNTEEEFNENQKEKNGKKKKKRSTGRKSI